KLTAAQLDSLAGEYREPNGKATTTIFREGEQLFERATGGEVTALQAESADSFFYPIGANSGVTIHVNVERDAQGRVTGYVMRDNRHEERWMRVNPAAGKQSRMD